jgi:hypothetical protein
MMATSKRLVAILGVLTLIAAPMAAAQDGDSPRGAGQPASSAATDFLGDLFKQGAQFLKGFQTAQTDQPILIFDEKKKDGKSGKPRKEKETKGKASLGVIIEESDGVVRIIDVVKGGPAERAGLEAEDMILKLRGRKIEGIEGLVEILSRISPGATVAVQVKRDGDLFNCKVKTGESKKVFGDRDVRIEKKEIHEKGDLQAHNEFLKKFLTSKEDNKIFLKAFGHDDDHVKIEAGDHEDIVIKKARKKESKEKDHKHHESFDLSDILKGLPESGNFSKTKTFSLPGGKGIVKIQVLGEDGEGAECHFEVDVEEEVIEECESGCPECRSRRKVHESQGDVVIKRFHGHEKNDPHVFMWHGKKGAESRDLTRHFKAHAGSCDGGEHCKVYILKMDDSGCGCKCCKCKCSNCKKGKPGITRRKSSGCDCGKHDVHFFESHHDGHGHDCDVKVLKHRCETKQPAQKVKKPKKQRRRAKKDDLF